MLKQVLLSFSFLKYIVTRRLSAIQIKAYISLSPILSFLLQFGFISYWKSLDVIILSTTHFATRPLINYARVFLKRSNKLIFNFKLISYLYYLTPSIIWLTVMQKKIISVNALKNKTVSQVPVYAYIT